MAAGSRIREFNLSEHSSWVEYVERIELYCAASKLTTDEDKRAVLLSCYGPETYSLIATLVKPSRPPNVDYQVIVDAVKKHVNPKPSELYARKTQDHGNADCLSRLPAPLTRQETEVPGDILLLEAVEYPPVSAREVAAYTSSDPQLSQVKKWILEGWPRERVAPEYSAYEHSTPHSETGKSPAEVMLGRNFRTAISTLQRDESEARCLLPPPQRGFLPGDTVYARNFRPGPEWVPGRVLRRLGHVMYELRTADGTVHRRHRDHVRRAWHDEPGGHETSPSFALPDTPSPTLGPVGPESPQHLRRSACQRRPVRRYGIDD
ncbi:uncharacterized protein LOC125943892 [Dermacentor silvarum]|uniref:uncharacterized protein LOC125943892 n=1 Tax=Dermacentor silvarum TaxID=543639 RepID=UPI00210128CB|nr:uncharacterized protein LOC125943892 [Dermacentor silvarum]